MDYFFVEPKDVHGRVALLRGDEFKHLARVLRKKAGERIMLVDGEDHAFEAVIHSIDDSHAECEILDVKQRFNEPRIDVTLAVSLLRNPARFDFLVEKVTELGVRAIVPLLCDRTVPRSEKHARFEKIALSAMKQCGRSFLPKIHPLSSLASVLDRAEDHALRLIPHEKTEQSHFIGSVLQHHAQATSALIVIGPEGGFTVEEMELANAKGLVPISLGPRRLRAETAAISAVNWVMGSW
ncbi:MAG: RsmE family RNA methyltransferase [Ignavibacteriales bacterium]|nr:RsmE family RNA methyltransferase [Ignavibacteriales bacterium]